MCVCNIKNTVNLEGSSFFYYDGFTIRFTSILLLFFTVSQIVKLFQGEVAFTVLKLQFYLKCGLFEQLTFFEANKNLKLKKESFSYLLFDTFFCNFNNIIICCASGISLMEIILAMTLNMANILIGGLQVQFLPCAKVSLGTTLSPTLLLVAIGWQCMSVEQSSVCECVCSLVYHVNS